MSISDMHEAQSRELRTKLDERGIAWRGNGKKSTTVMFPNGLKLECQTELYGFLVKFFTSDASQAIDAMVSIGSHGACDEGVDDASGDPTDS